MITANTDLENEKIIFEAALDFAKFVHQNQTRDDGSPYFNHIIGVVNILRNEFNINNYTILSIAALHDVIEDSEYDKDFLKTKFGTQIGEGVATLSKVKGQSIESYFSQIDNSNDRDILWQIKMADRIYNIRDLLNIVKSKPNKISKYILETDSYYIPVAKNMPKIFGDILKVSLENIKNITTISQ